MTQHEQQLRISCAQHLRRLAKENPRLSAEQLAAHLIQHRYFSISTPDLDRIEAEERGKLVQERVRQTDMGGLFQ